MALLAPAACRSPRNPTASRGGRMQGGRNRVPDDLRSKPDPGQTQEAASKGEGRKGKDAGQGLKPKLVQDFLRRPLSFLGGHFHKPLEVQGGMLARKEDILLADLFIPCNALILADLPIRIGTVK